MTRFACFVNGDCDCLGLAPAAVGDVLNPGLVNPGLNGLAVG